ncbi:MAG: hypothetical protein KJ970_16780 [Candidatus Eisenbacteria bacterium]|uniref:PorV/PorQ family protein n=1 Tax=Eiseniibacteriota bacterium TaxID=2212470 RepID=A0A948RY32_UNCEI|nr:hypothetical protein [Candidatus Eisenbacteria bacterium]MBU1948098.1 hypothetical protein [Candidatus Eisenbacteria bacterium]MBU2692571.1 hypothetical protein [Candidatus Eisenbacteria bacterium]
MRRGTYILNLLVPVFILLSIPSPRVHGQSATIAVSQFITPDARSQGMGRAFTAIAEGPSANWWNPGALGISRSFYFSPWSAARLVPDLADDVWMRTFGLTGHYRGIGLGAHVAYLSYGESPIVDGYGHAVGSFDSWEVVALLGAGIDVIQLMNPEQKNIRWGIGGNLKYFDLDLAPAGAGGVEGPATCSTWDMDLGTLMVLRLPLDVGADGNQSRSSAGTPPSFIGIRGGYMLKNVLDHTLKFPSEDMRYPLMRFDRLGLAFELGFMHMPPLGYLIRWNVLTLDWENVYFDGSYYNRAIDYRGTELTILGIFTVRHGYIDDKEGEVTDDTWGLGFGVDRSTEKFSRIGGRFDYASVPQAEGLDRVSHYTLSFWIGFQ